MGFSSQGALWRQAASTASRESQAAIAQRPMASNCWRLAPSRAWIDRPWSTLL